MREFDYLNGQDTQTLCTADSSMMMNVTVHVLQMGDVLTLHKADEEIAIVLIDGYVLMNGHEARRDSCIDHPGYCLHVCRDTAVKIISRADHCEILVQTTPNSEYFPPQFYTPEKARVGTFGEGQFEGKAERRVTTYFDIHNAPYSNMVCGEIVQPQGGWSSYPPHEHPHPEVYYYRFDKPQGFGACFLDDAVYKIRDRSFAAIEGGKYHPQVTAPGYAMMYVWMIRHFDGYPWDERNFHPEHQWLLEK
jgi:5-deoxy-glucuronate isomerase